MIQAKCKRCRYDGERLIKPCVICAAKLLQPFTAEPKLDCGDSSCLYAETRGGQRTNGGCRCHEKQGFRVFAHKWYLENKRLKSKIGEYEEASAICPEDVGFVEYIKYLQSKNKEMRQLLESAKIALECNPQTFPNTVKAIGEFLEENK